MIMRKKLLLITHFNYDYDLPYNFLKNIMTIITPDMLKKDINEAIIKKYKEKLSNIVNYSFLCPIFVYYDVSVISFSCLKLAFEKTKLKIKLIDIIDIIKANKEMDISSIDFNDIEVCSSLIDDLVLKKLNLNFNIQNFAINNNINNINLQNNETKLKNDLNDDKKNINDKYALLAKKRKQFFLEMILDIEEIKNTDLFFDIDLIRLILILKTDHVIFTNLFYIITD